MSKVIAAGWGILLAAVPVIDVAVGANGNLMRPVLTIVLFTLLGLSLHVVTGLTGLLNLGVAAFMAIGAYTYAIATCPIYPFQVNGWVALVLALGSGAIFGAVLGIPTLRLRGDYLAIVTLGFGEIVQDVLKNLESITKGTQGINPLPSPRLFGLGLVTESPYLWFYVCLLIVAGVAVAVVNLERSPFGMEWRAVAVDEIAAACMGIPVARAKVRAFMVGAAISALCGALWAASLGSSGEPSNYDFQVSVVALCIIIVGGVGSLVGTLVGAGIMVGFTTLVLGWLSRLLTEQGISAASAVYMSPNNWKYFAFGLALILMMRVRPQGLLGSKGPQ